MAEAEDVITDAARHATIYARDLWLRHRGDAGAPRLVILAEVAPRLDLLLTAILGHGYRLRHAPPPPIPTLLTRVFRRHDAPQSKVAVPATDGLSIWLPGDAQTTDHGLALDRYRSMALLQAMRAERGSAARLRETHCPRTRALYLLLEAYASEADMLALLPGMAEPLMSLRAWCLSQRPAIASIPPGCRRLEAWVHSLLKRGVDEPAASQLPRCANPDESLTAAKALIDAWRKYEPSAKAPHTHALYKDAWTGELIPPEAQQTMGDAGLTSDDEDASGPPRSAKLLRRPQERKADKDEDDGKPGTWMVQTNAPMEKAVDPLGMQRPADRDEDTAAEEFADALSELPEARLVSTPGKAKEVLLSDDPPEKRSRQATEQAKKAISERQYPEWDYRIGGYRHPGATVRLLRPQSGSQGWIDKTLTRHRTVLNTIRKRFEMLQARRVWLHRQMDGDDIDLEACIEARAEVRAGLPMPQALYRQHRPQRHDMAIMLLIDISGSTDSWLSEDRRIIDVEREALLLVALALDKLGQPYSIQAFSGEGPKGVTMTAIKSFTEPYSNEVAQRIAALEPQYYTRAGAALRHTTALLMRQPAEHRLLMLLSDGKPNDVDDYEGRYGVEDMRRAVEEAKQQGIFPFCLTIDRQAAKYLPAIFGARQYALLSKPESLPTVLLDWMRRLISS